MAGVRFVAGLSASTQAEEVGLLGRVVG